MNGDGVEARRESGKQLEVEAWALRQTHSVFPFGHLLPLSGGQHVRQDRTTRP